MPYLGRLQKLQSYLQNLSCDALLIEDPINIYYLTGLNLSSGKFLVHSSGAYLIVDHRYFEFCQKTCPYPVFPIDTPSFEIHLLNPDFSFIKTLAFDSETTSYKNYVDIKKYISAIEQSDKRHISLIPLENPVKQLRAIKDASEIAILREAALLNSQGFDFLCTLLQEGISESEMALELEIFWKRRGGKALAFDPIIAYGANSSMPHYRAGSERLKRGHSVLIDIGVNYNHYHSDMTRVIFFGKPDPRIQKIHDIVREAQEVALSKCLPGTLIGDLDAAAREVIASHGYAKNFTHSLGHGVGLEIHEFPVIKNISPYKDTRLAPGMVITIEPGIYLPGVGGIRLEDTVVITDKSHENLTNRDTSPFLSTVVKE
jgi:Xaa-Pro aminopeptidase